MVVFDGLRKALGNLGMLEEFCSAQDGGLDLYMTPNNPIWEGWPNLKVLAIYNPLLDEHFWLHMSLFPLLHTLVATRADAADDMDVKVFWRRWTENSGRPLKVDLVNVESEHRSPAGSSDWRASDVMRVRRVNVPISYYGDENPITVCQDWVRNTALRGGLESLDGTLLVGMESAERA